MANDDPRQQPPMQNIPIHTELGSEIRRSFLPPARGQSFVAFNFSQQEARLLDRLLVAQTARGRTVRAGGTRKIAELPPPPCQHSEHNPPAMMVYEPGVWEHVCPGCGARQVFTVDRPSL